MNESIRSQIPAQGCQTPPRPSIVFARLPRLCPVGSTSWCSGQVMGFADLGLLAPPCRLVPASCSSGQRFVSKLPFGLTQSPAKPLPIASTSPCRVCGGLSSLVDAPCRAHHKTPLKTGKAVKNLWIVRRTLLPAPFAHVLACEAQPTGRTGCNPEC